jgi:hypothetical protein
MTIGETKGRGEKSKSGKICTREWGKTEHRYKNTYGSIKKTKQKKIEKA